MIPTIPGELYGKNLRFEGLVQCYDATDPGNSTESDDDATDADDDATDADDDATDADDDATDA